jgi:hypothetical protein
MCVRPHSFKATWLERVLSATDLFLCRWAMSGVAAARININDMMMSFG